MGSVIRRGEIYWVQLDPTVGAEIKKTRPALVVSNNQSNKFSDLVCVLPITSKLKTVHPFEVLVPAGEGGLKTQGKIKANQIRTVDKRRILGEPLGPPLTSGLLSQVSRAVKIHLDIF